MEPIEPIVFPELAHAAVYFNDPDGNSLELIAQLPVGLPSEKKVYLSEWKNKFKHHHYIRIELLCQFLIPHFLKQIKLQQTILRTNIKCTWRLVSYSSFINIRL